MKTILRAKQWNDAVAAMNKLGFKLVNNNETTSKIYFQNTYREASLEYIKQVVWNNEEYIAILKNGNIMPLNKIELKSGDLKIVQSALYDIIDGASMHKEICEKLLNTYKAKNADYGDSFGEMFSSLGIITAVTRIGDKCNRLKTLTAKNQRKVKDETVRDTLMDMANYAIMTLIEMDVV